MTDKSKFYESVEEIAALYMKQEMERVALKQALEVISRSFKITEEGNFTKITPLTQGEVNLLKNGMKYIV